MVRIKGKDKRRGETKKEIMKMKRKKEKKKTKSDRCVTGDNFL